MKKKLLVSFIAAAAVTFTSLASISAEAKDIEQDSLYARYLTIQGLQKEDVQNLNESLSNLYTIRLFSGIQNTEFKTSDQQDSLYAKYLKIQSLTKGYIENLTKELAALNKIPTINEEQNTENTTPEADSTETENTLADANASETGDTTADLNSTGAGNTAADSNSTGSGNTTANSNSAGSGNTTAGSNSSGPSNTTANSNSAASGNTTPEANTGTSGTVTDSSSSQVNTSTSTAVNAFEQAVLQLTNAERAKVGLAPLTLDTELSKVARIKSQDMSSQNYFSHTSPTYGSPFNMMNTFGISYRSAAENIAQGQSTAEAVVQSWMNSQGHRENILSANYTHIGIGYVSAGNYWTQMFIGK